MDKQPELAGVQAEFSGTAMGGGFAVDEGVTLPEGLAEIERLTHAASVMLAGLSQRNENDAAEIDGVNFLIDAANAVVCSLRGGMKKAAE